MNFILKNNCIDIKKKYGCEIFGIYQENPLVRYNKSQKKIHALVQSLLHISLTHSFWT